MKLLKGLLYVTIALVLAWFLMLSLFYTYVGAVTIVGVHFGWTGMYIFTGVYILAVIVAGGLLMRKVVR